MVEFENEDEYYEDEYYEDEYEVYEAIRSKPQPRTHAYPTRSQKPKQPPPEGDIIYQSPSFDNDSMEVEPPRTIIPETTPPPKKVRIKRQQLVIDQVTPY